MNSDDEESLERNLFRKVEKWKVSLVELSIKRRTDGTLNYVR